MKMFEFTGLKILHRDMQVKKEDRAIFTLQYNGKSFNCILLTDIIPYRLYFTTLGSVPKVFEFEIEKGYKVKCYIDGYKMLIEYLDIKYDPKHKFLPFDFFKAINNKIPKEFKAHPDYKETLMVIAKRRKIEEEEKIYFCGWRRNAIGQNVSEKNYEKTRSAFGDEKALMSKRKNISSCWTDRDGDEELKRLSEIIVM
jgi:hypothetical protein